MFGFVFCWLLAFCSDTIVVVAHRGGHLESPENSLAAIDEAIRAGADMVELDVRMSKDGVLVLMHDKSLERTTGRREEVSALDWGELGTLFLLFEGKASRERIPSFEQALLHAKGRIKVDVDFKAEGMEAREQAYALIKRVGMEREVLFFLYDYTEMPALRALNPNITCMPRARTEADLHAIMAMDMCRTVHIDPSFEGLSVLKEARGKGYNLWINTLGEVDQQGIWGYREFLRRFPEVRYIQTDLPALLKQVLEK